MNSIPTRPSLSATVLVLMALIFITLSCHKETSPLGTEGAAVAHATASPDIPNTGAAVKGNAASDATPTVASTSGPRDKRDRDRGQQSISYEAKRANETVAAARESAAASDPSELVAQATELLNRTKRADAVTYRAFAYVVRDGASVEAGPSSHTADYRAAADTAQKVIDLLKTQTAPTEPAAKQKYAELLLAALSARATALGFLATQDHAEADRAESAYREYLVAETNEAKRTRAEYDLAALFYNVEQFQKAKLAFEQLLTRNRDDRRALAALVRIHEKLAEAEKAVGDTVNAEVDLASAKEYTERLRDVNTASKADSGETSSTTTASADDVTVDRANPGRTNEPVNRASEKVMRKEAIRPAANAKRPSPMKP